MATNRQEPWPGSQPPTTREVQAANRRLITAMRKHKEAKKQLALAERNLREARTVVKTLIDLLARGPVVNGGPRCEDCKELLGQNPLCVTCQAFGSETTPVRY